MSDRLRAALAALGALLLVVGLLGAIVALYWLLVG